MFRAIVVAALMAVVSGCCVVESFLYEPTVDEQLERDRDLKAHPALLNGVGFSA